MIRSHNTNLFFPGQTFVKPTQFSFISSIIIRRVVVAYHWYFLCRTVGSLHINYLVPGVVHAPDGALLERLVQVLFYGVEEKPEDLTQLHTKSERSFHSRVFLCKEVEY